MCGKMQDMLKKQQTALQMYKNYQNFEISCVRVTSSKHKLKLPSIN
jgi:hypothetical protein